MKEDISSPALIHKATLNGESFNNGWVDDKDFA